MNINANNGIFNKELLKNVLISNSVNPKSDSEQATFLFLLNSLLKNGEENKGNTINNLQDNTNKNLSDMPLKYHPSYYKLDNIEKIKTNSQQSNSSDVMSKINESVNKSSTKYGIDKNLILSIINHESRFETNVTSSAGAQGLMQILPSNFSDLGITNGYDIEQNIDGGTKLLKNCIDLYGGDFKLGLVAYAGGCGIMKSRGVNDYSDLYKMPMETQKAVNEIIEEYNTRKNSK